MSVGKMTTLIWGESLAKSMNCKFVMSVNVLSTYCKRECDSFFKLMKEYDINPNSYWIDKDHINELLNRKLFLKIYSLLVLKWAKKDNVFDDSLLKYINSMNVEKKQLLYEIMLSEIEKEENIVEDLRKVLTKKYNFQMLVWN